jgi:8-amino-7-oxononanoate synthase
VVEAGREALRLYGASVGGSRLTTGNSFLYAELEAELARFKRAERAVVFSSGYATNVGAIPALTADGDLILSDERNHASLIDGCRLSRAEKRIYQHGDPDHAYFHLRDRSRFRRALVVTDGVFSMDGDIAPLPGLCELADECGAAVLVDDAHGFGVLGDGGRGTVDHFGLAGHPAVLQMGTLSKALGALGGYVASSEPVIETLRQRARSFMFSTGLPPSVLAAAWQGLRVLQEEPHLLSSLRANAAYLRAELRRVGFRVPTGETPIIPLVIGGTEEALRFSEACLRRGLFAPAIRPPTVPKGTSRVRLSVMATHTSSDLERAVEILVAAARETRVA